VEGSAVKTALQFIADSLKDADGKPSSMRLMTFVVTILFALALTFVLVWECVTNDADVVTLAALYMATVLGALGIKKWQNDTENKIQASTTTTATTITSEDKRSG
jgi:hypothetical protein